MKRFVYIVLAVFLIALGVTSLRFSNFGTDPFNCMNLGVSSHLPISYGTYQLLVNILIFVPLYLLKPSILGLGAIANMFFCAYVVEGFSFAFHKMGIANESLQDCFLMRIIFLIVGLCCMCFGAALYMECNMGMAAYDALGLIIEEKVSGRIKYQNIRIATDITCILIGVFTGSAVGIGTIISAFFTGPLISKLRKWISKRN
ncbi:MAG: YitT family protein [Lachnospiraceae bacterium]